MLTVNQNTCVYRNLKTLSKYYSHVDPSPRERGRLERKNCIRIDEENASIP